MPDTLTSNFANTCILETDQGNNKTPWINGIEILGVVCPINMVT